MTTGAEPAKYPEGDGSSRVPFEDNHTKDQELHILEHHLPYNPELQGTVDDLSKQIESGAADQKP